MTRQGRWPRRLRGVLLAVTLLGTTGCLSFCHPVAPPSKELAAPCTVLPQDCRNHVHMFFVHGLDPLDFANLSGVRDYVQSLGFVKTHYGQLYHVFQFKKDILRIHQEDPEARFVLVGFSFGANMVRDLANVARENDIPIDLLIYLGGNTLENIPRDRPDNVLRLVNILATGWIWNGTTFDGAENLNYSGVWHFGSPSHLKTLEVLARELSVVASRVPIVERVEPPSVEDAPTRRLIKAEDDAGEEWDFLRPEVGLRRKHGLPPFPQGGETTIVPVSTGRWR